MMRIQFPLVAGFALTVNKAQGLTLKEGVVIHLVGSRKFRPAAKHGLPFVAWTRSESFAMTAFKNLPPWSDFVKGRESPTLKLRQTFTDWLEELHVETLKKHSSMASRDEEQAAHDAWIPPPPPADESVPPTRKICPACEAAASRADSL